MFSNSAHYSGIKIFNILASYQKLYEQNGTTESSNERCLNTHFIYAADEFMVKMTYNVFKAFFISIWYNLSAVYVWI
jgi:hypothetical protein